MIEQIANILNEKMYNILEAMRPISLLNEKKKTQMEFSLVKKCWKTISQKTIVITDFNLGYAEFPKKAVHS